MKKLIAGTLALLAAVSLCTPALAEEGAQKESYTIFVNDRQLDLAGLPTAPYAENGTVMVPLRKVGEALGYRVSWDAAAQAVTIAPSMAEICGAAE